YARNWMFYLQRVSAIITTIFVIFHVLTLKVFTNGVADTLVTFVQMLNNPLIFVLYCICVLAAIFHFSNGLFTLLITWGIIQGPRVQKIFTGITMAIFVILSVVSIVILGTIAGYHIL
ncbi:MAG: succinate dehydrogenase, partial [Bacillota bacterium]|nr:succinate dehydrogenase [Bacillota bacterium]